MQILSKGGAVRIKLDQSEGRRMRDASYIACRAAINLVDEEKAKQLREAAEVILEFANSHTPEVSQRKLDQQDSQAPETKV